MIKQIKGCRNTRQIIYGDKELFPRRSQQVWNHSPDGFNWGYGGSGPAQLALALLLEETTAKIAIRLHQKLKWDFVCQLPQSDFDVQFDILNWINKQKEAENDKDSARV